MACVKKCDRCGNVYEAHDHPVIFPDSCGYKMHAKQIQLIGETNDEEYDIMSDRHYEIKGRSFSKEYDLCEQCMDEFKTWLAEKM